MDSLDKETEWKELLESIKREIDEHDLVFAAECSQYVYEFEDRLARGRAGFEGQNYVKPSPPIKRTRRMLELYQKDAKRRTGSWLEGHAKP